ncbi:GNAT family N-acetyltransferase [Thalassobacillus hwangdonensis]|uniref:GNAT family N-acetyltransferase n=1 Tax=Thalassobacillus hwangdonensis TaxID=546108 RepID=A0ABW3L195_9BACI
MEEKTFYPFPELETERLMLREVCPDDAESMFETFGNKEAMEYYGMHVHETVEDTNQLIERMQTNLEAGKSIRWAIVDKKSGKCIGTCGFHRLDEHKKRGEVGYEINPSLWRKGYMKEALHAIIYYGFEGFGFHRIEGIVLGNNEPSKQLLRKLNFTHEGSLTDRYYFRDRFWDEHYFGLINPNGGVK